MFDAKTILISVISVTIISVFGYMLLLMLEPSPYAEMVAKHAISDNGKAASQILAAINGNPKCGKTNISRASLLRYYKSQEYFMLQTEIRKHRRPTRAALLAHGHEFLGDFSSRLKPCMSPEKRRRLMGRVAYGKNLKMFLGEIDRSKHDPGQLERVRHKMRRGS